MSAYLNALREEGTRDDLLREIERLREANVELKDERSRLLTALRDLRDGVVIAVDSALEG